MFKLIVNINVNHGLLVIMKYQCKFINCNKYATLKEVTDYEGVYGCTEE